VNGAVALFWLLFAIALMLLGTAVLLYQSGRFVPTTGVLS